MRVYNINHAPKCTNGAWLQQRLANECGGLDDLMPARVARKLKDKTEDGIIGSTIRST